MRLLLLLVLSVSSSFVEAQSHPPLFTSCSGFNLNDHVVSTSVFHWYTSTGGQLSGPWLPLDGRQNWTGTASWWKSQIKQMMTANIDLLYVHLIPHMEQQRINLFDALSQLRAEGYDVPKVAPFLDPVITWSIYGTTPDLATAAGKDAFVAEYIRFFNQYFSVNTDAFADNYLATIGGRVVLDTWHVHLNLQNYTSLTRTDVETRLKIAFAAAHPIFNNGIYMVTTAFSPTFVFADEKVPQFEVHEYFRTQAYNGITAAQIKGGYWDQNIRTPGYILPRDGGSHYRTAWNNVNRNTVKRMYIESWNEYDEGSGIYAVDTVNSPHKIAGNPSNDTWSSSQAPYEYIKMTAEGIRSFNDRPDRNARILWHNFPSVMWAGGHKTVQIIVRNEGDMMWNEPNQFRFGQKEFLPGEVLFGAGRYVIDNAANEVGIYGGVFRGRPVVFEFEMVAPDQPGEYLNHYAMVQENIAWFGEELAQDIFVYRRGDLDTNGIVNFNDLRLLVGQWLESRSVNGDGSCAETMIGDINSDCKVDFEDFAILSNDWENQSWHFRESTITDKLGSSHVAGTYFLRPMIFLTRELMNLP